MRVIAGTLGGRQFDSPRGHRTHPMSDKVRGALFNVLGDIEGLTVLDAYAGSGALSIEAVSRGAARALAIDIDREAARTVRDNTARLGITDRIQVVQQNVSSWSDAHPDARFDIVVADPPYDDIKVQVLDKLANHVTEDGLLALSWPGSEVPPVMTGMQVAARKSYGDAQLVFYRRV